MCAKVSACAGVREQGLELELASETLHVDCTALRHLHNTTWRFTATMQAFVFKSLTTDVAITCAS